MTDASRPLERGGRRGRRRLSPVQGYEAFVQVLTGEMTVAQCADHWGVDRSTVMRAREVAKKGALDALASSRPGTRSGGVDPELVMARDEAARLGEALKEMAVKVALSQKRALGVTAGVPPRVEAGTKEISHLVSGDSTRGRRRTSFSLTDNSSQIAPRACQHQFISEPYLRVELRCRTAPQASWRWVAMVRGCGWRRVGRR